jgi:hypothetical protein
MPVTPTEAIGALNVGGVDDHQHSGEVSASPFAPFRHRAFFWLWLGVVIASIGSWGQMVGAQWLFVNDPNAATIVPLVQTASTLPMMLLALPAGVLADAFDRRWMMFVIEVYFITVSALLAVLTALGRMPPALLLAFTFAVGAGQAMLSPTWQAMITELVPRSEFAAATRLDMVSVNVSRAAGPAIVRECPSWATDARAWGRLGPGRSGEQAGPMAARSCGYLPSVGNLHTAGMRLRSEAQL